MKAEPRHPAPPMPSSPAATSSNVKNEAPAQPALRRSESDRLRSTWASREFDAQPSADGQFFAQLIAPVDEGGEQQGWGGGAIALPAPSEEMPTELVDELVQHLTKDPLARLDITLLMPNLGRIDVKASAREGHWSIELGFARRDVLKRLRPRQRACEAALANALGQPVELSMLDEACV